MDLGILHNNNNYIEICQDLFYHELHVSINYYANSFKTALPLL